MKIPPLFEHQKRSLKFLKFRPGVFDMSDPGTAKTRVEIEDFARRRAAGGGCALILAPKSILYNAWGLDIETFAPHLTYAIANAENRSEAFARDVDIYITNHDAVKWLARQPSKFFHRFRAGTLVVDESPAYKHLNSDRSKAVRKITKYFEYRRVMTGTPTSNGITDIWHQVYILDDGQRLGQSFYHFRNSVCTQTSVSKRNKNAVRWEDRPGAELAVMALLKDIVIRHKFEDCVDIPPCFEHSRLISLTPAHMGIYHQLRSKAIVQIKEHRVSAVNAAVLIGKLHQVASGTVYDESSDGYVLVDRSRYDYILDEIQTRKHAIIFFLWMHQRDALIQEAERRGMTFACIEGSTSMRSRREIVTAFQAGVYQVLFAHPQTAGHGLTLTRATTIIWASPTYNLEFFKQGNHRIYRVGQTQKTEVIVVVAKGTIDEIIYKACKSKEVNMTNLLHLIQECRD